MDVPNAVIVVTGGTGGIGRAMARRFATDGPGAVVIVDRSGTAAAVDEIEAAGVTEGLADDRFLILPHPEVSTFERRRAGDRDRWLTGMQKLQASLPGA